MTPQEWLTALEKLPRLGWAEQWPPMRTLPMLAKKLGLPWLAVAQDNLTHPLHGGSKLRKLDYLLAAQPWAGADLWHTAGAIGSGHLVACTAAAQSLGKSLHAHIFDEPETPGIADSLAYTVSYATKLSFYRSRLSLGLFAPKVVLGSLNARAPVILPGGTHGVAMLGLVRAGLQLAQAVQNGELPCPERLYVSFGSGGTAVGLAAGLGLAGLPTVVHGVLAVEPLFATQRRLRHLQALVRRELVAVCAPQPVPWPCRVVLDRDHVGPGYGHPTAAAHRAQQQFADHDVALEVVYTGKAAAALLADHAPGERSPAGPVLFWHTLRRQDPLPRADDWQQRLPPWLRQRFHDGQPRMSRRKWIAVTGVAVSTIALGTRAALATRLPGWRGEWMSSAQAATIYAACELMLPPGPPPGAAPQPWLPVVAAVDKSCSAMPAALRGDIVMLLSAIAQAPLLCGHVADFAALPVADRRAALAWLACRPHPVCDAFAGLCNLVMLGYYQLPEHFAALQYAGPMVPAVARPRRPSWDRLAAPPGALPAGLRVG